MSLRKRLTIWYSALLVAIIVVMGMAVYGIMQWALINDIDSMLDETADLINNNSSFVPLQGYEPSIPFGIDLPSLDVFRASGVEVQVWLKHEGNYHFVDSSANLRGYDQPLDADMLGTQTNVYHNVSIGGSEWRVRTSPIVFGQNVVGSIQVAGSLAPVHQALRGLLFTILFSGAIAGLGAALLSRVLARRVIQPITDITQAASYIAGAKDLSTRLEYDGPMDEIGQLNAVFNQMMQRLEHIFTVQQRFVADISHELRTPLTTVRGNVELIKRYGVDDQGIEAIYSEVDRMSRLVNDLLMLARADYGGLEIELHPLDLDSLIMDVFQNGKSMAHAKARALEFKLTHIEPLQINGNPDRMKQVLFNLIDNAIKHTLDGGTIALSLARQGQYAVIRVSDTGIGIPPEHVERIFDRFYQTDPSRVHHNHSDGFGLGLSIAKWIVEAHQGTITVESQPQRGTTFIISVPLLGAHLEDDDDSATRIITKTRVAISRRKRDENPVKP